MQPPSLPNPAKRNLALLRWLHLKLSCDFCIRGISETDGEHRRSNGRTLRTGQRGMSEQGVENPADSGRTLGEKRIAGRVSSVCKPQVVGSRERKAPDRQWQEDELGEKRCFASKARGFEV